MDQLKEQILGQFMIDDALQLEQVYFPSVRDVRLFRDVHEVETYDVGDVGGVEVRFVAEYLPDSLDRVRIELGVALLMRGSYVRPRQTRMQSRVYAGAERHSIHGQQNLPYPPFLYDVQNIFACVKIDRYIRQRISSIVITSYRKIRKKGGAIVELFYGMVKSEELTGEAAEHEILG